MADDAPAPRPAAPAREELVAAYKRLLQAYLDRRPSGMRLKIAKAMGKHRSFVSQIANPAYSVPIPARHLETIFRICHFSPEERKSFLAAYAAAHPHQRLEGAAAPRRRKTGTRTLELELPDTGDVDFDAAVDDMLRHLARQLARLARRS
jgi:hypothetical protein